MTKFAKSLAFIKDGMRFEFIQRFEPFASRFLRGRWALARTLKIALLRLTTYLTKMVRDACCTLENTMVQIAEKTKEKHVEGLRRSQAKTR